ncbi:MAG: DNA repair protein RadA [Pseudomonadota bacterium]
MARKGPSYACTVCGNVTARWAGRCEQCGNWNTIEELPPEAPVAAGKRSTTPKAGAGALLVPLAGETEDAPRIETGIAELDRVAGGGLVRGSALLVGGEPGIGKSTLVLQAAARLALNGHKVVYVSGEEAVAQVRLRADRLGVLDAPLDLAPETHVETVLSGLGRQGAPDLIIVDSIQTLWTDAIESPPGTVGQVRAAAQTMIRYAKQTGAAVVLVGHVTKDGQIAGPKLVEHMVDGVLYFEGDPSHQFRILRAVKNRFGPTDEIGVFEMTGGGLSEVANPSLLFLGDRDAATPGSAVFAGMEGSRPLLVEIQALVAPSSLASPRRAVLGWDANRLSMVLAVLDAHCGLKLSSHDVFLNIAGGLRIQEPAADLAVAAALISSLARTPLAADRVFFGEISLSGSVRAVSQTPARLKEAQKLGFSSATLPDSSVDDASRKLGLTLSGVQTLPDLTAKISAPDQISGDDGARFQAQALVSAERGVP